MKKIITITTLFVSISLNLLGQVIPLDDLESFFKENPSAKAVVIKNGVYQDATINLNRLNNVVITAERPGGVIIAGKTNITFRNCDGLVFSGFHFKQTWSQYLIKLDNVSNSSIQNCFFDRCEGNAYSRIIGLQGGSVNNAIAENTFDRIHTIGITVSKDDNFHNTITKNVFKNTPRVKSVHPHSPDGNGMESILIGTIATWDEEMENRAFHTVISYNYFENIEGDMNEIVCLKANNNIVENNYFTHNEGGISLRYGNENIVRNNVFVRNKQNIRVFGRGHFIANNIIFDDKIGIQLPSSDLENDDQGVRSKKAGYFRSTNIVIRNNTILTQDSIPFSVGANYTEKRQLLPTDIIIKNNRIRTLDGKKLKRRSLKPVMGNFKLKNNRSPREDVRPENLFARDNYFFGKTW